MADPVASGLEVHILQRNITGGWHELSHSCFFNAQFMFCAHFPDYQCIVMCNRSTVFPYLVIKYDFSSGVISSKLYPKNVIAYLSWRTVSPCMEYQSRLVFLCFPKDHVVDVETGQIEEMKITQPPSLHQLPSWVSYKNAHTRLHKYFDFLGSSLLLYESKQEKNPLFVNKKKRKRNSTDTKVTKYLVKNYISCFEQYSSIPPQRFLLTEIPLKSNVEVTIGGNGTFMLYETQNTLWSTPKSDSIVLFT